MCLSSAFCFFLYFLLAHSDHSSLATPFLTVPNWPSRTKVSQLCLYIILRLLNVKLPNWKLNMSAVRTGTKQSTGYQRNECMRVFCAVVRRRRCRRRRRRRMCVGIYSKYVQNKCVLENCRMRKTHGIQRSGAIFSAINTVTLSHKHNTQTLHPLMYACTVTRPG